jgi:hypothetical protein
MDTQTNLSRLAKIGDILDLLEHSAQSRRVTPRELETFLLPVYMKIAEVVPTFGANEHSHLRPSDQGENRGSSSEQATQPDAVEAGARGGEGGQALPTTGGHAGGDYLTHTVKSLDMARTIPLDEAVAVLQIIAARIDAELYERRTA